MFTVNVETRSRRDRRTAGMEMLGPEHHRVHEVTDVKEWDGHLVIEGCAFDYVRPATKDRPGFRRHIDARVTIYPPGEWLRVDIKPVSD